MWRIIWARWIGESVNGLLPVAQIGGDIAKARLLIKRQLPAAETGATVVVDTTLAAVGQMLFAIAGLVLAQVGMDNQSQRLARRLAAGQFVETALQVVEGHRAGIGTHGVEGGGRGGRHLGVKRALVWISNHAFRSEVRAAQRHSRTSRGCQS